MVMEDVLIEVLQYIHSVRIWGGGQCETSVCANCLRVPVSNGVLAFPG